MPRTSYFLEVKVCIHIKQTEKSAVPFLFSALLKDAAEHF
jgi:hypothetical protein